MKPAFLAGLLLLAALIGLPLAPGSVDGRCLDLDAGPGTTCPAH